MEGSLHRSRWIRGLYFAAGVAALVAGLLGIVLPVLPTTQFVLLAAACFAKSSDRFYNALLNHRLTGPLIADWRTHGAMQRKTKHWAVLMMALSFGTSIIVIHSFWHRIMLLAMATILGVFYLACPRAARAPDRPNSGNRLSRDLTPFAV